MPVGKFKFQVFLFMGRIVPGVHMAIQELLSDMQMTAQVQGDRNHRVGHAGSEALCPQKKSIPRWFKPQLPGSLPSLYHL